MSEQENETGPAYVGQVIKDTYEITGFLTAGGYGVIYTGEHRRLKTPVAVKILMQAEDARLRGRFIQEAQAAAQIRHPNVVGIYDYDLLESGEPYMVMDLLEGHDLGKELHLRGPMRLQRALSLLIPALDGLAKAHDLGIVHKDLKPPNLFLVHPGAGDEHLCILDFGIARLLKPKTEAPRKPGPDDALLEGVPENLTISGKPVGTARYIAPEYLRDQDNVTPAVDVYQLGLILVEMLTGDCVVKGEGWVALAMKHVEGALDIPEEILKHPDLGPIVKRATQRDPNKRYQHASEFKDALERLRHTQIALPTLGKPKRTGPLEEQPTMMLTAPPTMALSTPPEVGRQSAPIAWIAIAAAITAVLIVAAGVYYVFTKQKTIDKGQDKGQVTGEGPKKGGQGPEASPDAPPCPKRYTQGVGGCVPVNSEGMIVVPAGDFEMGCSEKLDPLCLGNEKPGRSVTLEVFEIDLLEVTVGAYASCVKASACTEPTEDGDLCSRYANWRRRDNRSDHPINCVTFVQAEAFCAWKGKRLPTEAEWQKAARGTEDVRIYPWGNEVPSCDLACINTIAKGPGCGRASTCPVGGFKAGRSPYGALDMGGNVSEWTSDFYAADYYAGGHNNNPTGPESGTSHAVHGGAFANDKPRLLRISNRLELSPKLSHGFVGFRCAQDFPAAE